MARLVNYKRGGIGSQLQGGSVDLLEHHIIGLREFIDANEKIVERLPVVDDVLAQFLARVADAFAHKWSGGPIRGRGMSPGWWTPGALDPRRNPKTGRFQKQYFRDPSTGKFAKKEYNESWAYKNSRAWSFPVPRLTGDYYAGWKVKKIMNGVWMNYNQTREAYFIEYGIHPSQKKVRIPVAKKSAMDTLNFMFSHGFAAKFVDNALSPLLRQGVQSPPIQPMVFPE